MQQNDLKVQTPHDLVMNDRSRLSISGVNEVDNYDSFEITVETSFGTLVISGNNLKIEKLSVDDGEIVILGSIDSLVYSKSRTHTSLLTKLFN